MLKKLFEGQWPAAMLFDLDGTLIDSVPELSRALDTALVAEGLPSVGCDNARLWVGNGAHKLVERALSHILQMPEGQVPADRLDDTYRRFLAAYSDSKSRPQDLYNGVAETLQRLNEQSIKLAIITNKPVQFVPQILHDCGIARHFKLVLGGDSLAQKKPHPAPLLHAMEKLAVKPQASLMVGDSANDIDAANAAGIRSVCVTYGYNHGHNPQQLPATAHIDRFADLLAD